MPTAIAALLMALGCAPIEVATPRGDAFGIWVCPPVAAEATTPPPAAPLPPPPREEGA
jgi:hypothetical protein